VSTEKQPINPCATCLQRAPAYKFKLAPQTSKYWESQPRYRGQFTNARERSSTIVPSSIPPTPTESTLPSLPSSLSSSLSSSPASERPFGSPSSHTSSLPQLPPTQSTSIITLQLPQRTMSHERVPTFAGTGNDEVQPSEFIKIFRRATRGSFTDEGSWIVGLGDYLKTGSPAEAWFLLGTTPKKTWTTFKPAFEKEFPDIGRAEKTPQDLERELLAMRLRPENLGKTERYANDDVWTHVAFAQRALDLARRAGISAGTNNIWQVRDALPDMVREKVPEKQTDWTTFCNAIKQVDVGHIKEGARKHAAEQQEKARLRSEMDALRNAVITAKTPDTPTKGISSQLGRTTISQNAPQPAAAPNTQNPFTTAGGGRGNLFWSQQTTTRNNTRQPSSTTNVEDEITIIRNTISQFPMAETIQTWMEQVRQWRIKNGDSGRVTKYSGFPLRPGGAPPGSSECYKCGKVGHTRINCTTQPGDCIPEKEAIFRSICGSILRGTRQSSAQVNHVGTTESDDEWLWKSNIHQGNGEGPSA
jgi:hypothetical protein